VLEFHVRYTVPTNTRKLTHTHSSPDLPIMVKPVAYLPPASPERRRKDRWFDYGHFMVHEFTDPEFAVSGFEDRVFDNECQNENFEQLVSHVSACIGRMSPVLARRQRHQRSSSTGARRETELP